MNKELDNIKKWISRSDLKENIMRDMILRVDFNILDEITRFITNHKEYLLSKFGNDYNKSSESEIKVEFKPDLLELQKSLSLPIKELESSIVHSFKRTDDFGNEITLLLTDYYISLNVKCIKYQGISSYVKEFSEIMAIFLEFMKPVNLKRFGLRKIGYDVYYSFEDIIKEFEGKEFGISLQEEFETKNEKMTQLLKTKDNMYNINYTKIIEDGKVLDPKTKEIKPAYRVILDIDGYFNFEKLKWNKRQDIDETIINLNEYLFKLFIKAVTKEFLYKNKND